MLSQRDSIPLSSAQLAIGTTTSKITTGGAVNYLVDGTSVQKAATADLFTPAGTALAANQVCAFFCMLDAAGAASVQQSAVKAASTATSGYVPGAFEWPQVAGKCVVGAVVIKSGGSAFTPGTTALTGVATYVNNVGDFGKPITY